LERYFRYPGFAERADRPSGAASSAALAVVLARSGADKSSIRTEIEDRFGYDLARSLAAIRPS
jgi:hypothetical protein